MKLTFLGTRGEIEPRGRRHGMHTALLVSYRRGRILIDCGADWRGRLHTIQPDAIVITHAHADHVGALRDGAPCPVHATAAAWTKLARYPLTLPRTVVARHPFSIGAIRLEAFDVEHSSIAPAVGYRIMAGKVAVFFAPDVVLIREISQALAGVRAYIGDGASVARPIIRRRGGALVGHASVRTQIGWCSAHGVPRFIVTHCGSQIVRSDARTVRTWLRAESAGTGVEVDLAYDGFEVVLL